MAPHRVEPLVVQCDNRRQDGGHLKDVLNRAHIRKRVEMHDICAELLNSVGIETGHGRSERSRQQRLLSLRESIEGRVNPLPWTREESVSQGSERIAQSSPVQVDESRVYSRGPERLDGAGRGDAGTTSEGGKNV